MKRLSWALVIYTILVILWGAWVRISHSGDGCGQSWPLCDGALFPKDSSSEVWIEYFHRLTSGLYGLFVVGLYLLIRKKFPPHSAQRFAGLATLILTVIEAGLGAALVLKGLVGENATIYRLVVMSLHQINSLLLVGSTVITALLVAEKSDVRPHWKGLFLHKGFLLIFMIIPATGAWAALSNTLFPSQHLLQGLAEDFASDSPWILRLRIL
ncbi:MAG: COX15/CtaA family protein, partial [Bdellovibrionales bacterium]